MVGACSRPLHGLVPLVESVLHAGLPDTQWRGLVANLGYSVGFIVAVLGRQQLFTENTLTVVLPLMDDLRWQKFVSVCRVWATVLVSNVIGTLLFAFAASSTDLLSQDAGHALTQIGIHAVEPGFWTILIRAIAAGWLVALMVWLLPAAGSSKLAIILIITYVIGLAGFAHVIAGSAEVAYAAFEGEVSWAEYGLEFILPALMGNILGGVLLVAVLNHAQVST